MAIAVPLFVARRLKMSPRYGVGLVAAYGAILFTIAYKYIFQHSVVEFRYAHEAGSARTQWKELRPYIIGAVVGGFMYATAERIIRALWP